MIVQTLFAVFWICSVSAAPMATEENTMEDENRTSSCFKDILPGHLRLHYDACVGNNNLSGDPVIRENEILSCIFKIAGLISEEETVDVSKMKMVPVIEDEVEVTKVVDDASPFIISVEKCEANEEMEKAGDFVQCLFETLNVNCSMNSEDEAIREENAEES